jgi:hypothetical protein
MPPTVPPTTANLASIAGEPHSTHHGRTLSIWENVKAYGALGDGATDDTTAIQAAIDTGEPVFFPPGTYRHGDLTCPPTVPLVGSVFGAVLEYTGSGVAVTMTQPDVSPVYESPRIENLRLVDVGTGTKGILIQAFNPVTHSRPAVRGLLKNVQVSGFSTAGIHLNDALEMTLLNCYVQSCGDGLLLSNQSNATTILGGAYRTSTNGIHVDTANSTISDLFISPATVIESNSTYGLLIDGANSLINAVIGGHYEGNTTRAIYANAGAAATGLIGSSLMGVYATSVIEFVNCLIVNIASFYTTSTITLGSGTRDVFASGLPSSVTVTNSGQRNVIGKPDTVGNAIGGVNFTGLIKSTRHAVGGTNLVSGDIALSAGWGNTASAALQNNSSDGRFRIAITSGGTGQGANPTVTLTFKDGTWGGAPHGVVSRGDVAAPNGDFRKTAQTATTWTITFAETPVAGNVYILDGIAVGQ